MVGEGQRTDGSVSISSTWAKAGGSHIKSTMALSFLSFKRSHPCTEAWPGAFTFHESGNYYDAFQCSWLVENPVVHRCSYFPKGNTLPFLSLVLQLPWEASQLGPSNAIFLGGSLPLLNRPLSGVWCFDQILVLFIVSAVLGLHHCSVCPLLSLPVSCLLLPSVAPCHSVLHLSILFPSEC